MVLTAFSRRTCRTLEIMMQRIPFETDGDIETAITNIERPIPFVVEPGDVCFCGQVLNSVYGYRMGIKTPRLHDILRDFEEYESSHKRTPVVFVHKNVTLSHPRATGNSVQEEWVVHSTDKDAGASILRSGCLFSRQHLEDTGISFSAFGRETLGEPRDYFDLIEFALVDDPLFLYSPECVVACKQQERFITKTDRYTPGIRFYFENASLRDLPGYTPFLGRTAVRKVVPLDRVHHWKITPADLGDKSEWTPESFTDAANERFREWISNKSSQPPCRGAAPPSG